jgi:hypothetical protein
MSISAFDYSTNPCDAPTTISESSTHFQMTGGCFQVLFPKSASELISFYDTYNKKSFALKLYSILDVNNANPNQKRTFAFEDTSTIVSSDGTKVYYTRPADHIVVSYSIDKNQIKAGVEMQNFVSNYAIGRVELRTRIMKDPSASAHFTNLPAIVDGIEQPLIVTTETAGQNQFFVQTLFTGNSFTSLIIDPIYTVDFSPIPALYLEHGNVTASLDSQFINSTDITTGISDNLTGTTYSTFEASPSGASASTGLISANSSTGGWASEQNAYADGGTVSTAGAADISQWWGYNFNIPTGATITNITVRLDLYKNLVGNTHYIQCVNLSWDSGTTYTTCQNLSTPTTTEIAYNLSGLWGRSWTAAEMNSAFRVQVASSTGTVGVLDLDWIPVTVEYTYPVANLSNGSAISGKWAETFDPAYQYFLRLYKTSSGSTTLYAYAYNSTNSISTQSTSSVLSGTGWFNINVTSLVDYMTNTLALNFSAFRFYTNDTQSFSEERLRVETNDTTPPTINSCSTNSTILGCGGTALLTCNVTDNIDVYEVSFTVDATYNTGHSGDLWQYDFSPVASTNSSGIIYDWSNTNALDIFLQSSNYDPNIQINYTCCVPNWVAQYGFCEANDSMLKTYTDTNLCGSSSGLPVDNGSSVYCNFCSEDLEKHYDYGECNISGLRAFDWHDHNFLSCCVITMLPSDCSIQFSPYNATDYENCTATYHDFALDLDAELGFGFGIGGLASDKAYGKIWLNDTNNTYTCVSYVKTTEGQIIQTNPPYTKRTVSTISLIPKEIEDREFFIPQQGLANVYWTDNNLVIDGRQYVFGVECVGNDQRLRSEIISTVGYKSLNSPITRYFWVGNNIVPLIIGILFVIAIALFIGYVYRRAKYG